MQTISQRRVSFERMAEMYRAMHNRRQMFDRDVTLADIEGLRPGDSFAEFIELNRDRIQLYEEARPF